MKAKLIRTRDNGFLTYVLKREDGKTIAMERYPFPSESTYLAESHGIELQKLSPENCDEIFGVVDVKKLAEKEYPKTSSWKVEEEFDPIRRGFIEGFNKAMQLNKDKVFTLEDMRTMMVIGAACEREKGDFTFEFKAYTNHLQQPTEIEVEIETETKVWDFISNGEFESFEIVPKLDSNNCLILKKI
jgi:hypothetical protein